MSDQIDILLATYNGEKYLGKQIQSILSQTYSNFHLIIRDDGSTDQTLSIIQTFIRQNPKKIKLLPFTHKLSAQGNFSMLLTQSMSPYAMLCDQDDIWFPGKIAETFSKMKQLENQFGQKTPLLVHTDLKVVDENLNIINHSFWNYTNLDPSRSHSLSRLLVQNVVTGCTVMLNRPLIKAVLPIPAEAIMHDWWIALAAAAFGKIDTVNHSTISYRQHSTNTLGAKNFRSLKQVLGGLKRLKQNDGKKNCQARLFLERYQEVLQPKERELLKTFLSLPDQSWAKKRYLTLKHRFLKNGFLRNAAGFLLN